MISSYLDNTNTNKNLNVVYNFVHLYSFICHLQVVSHGTIAYMTSYALVGKHSIKEHVFGEHDSG